MEFEQLRAFLTLAHTKNFSKTAETLHLVQSTISMRIRLLEEAVGKPLFVRDNRKVELTPAGQFLLTYAERVLTLRTEAIHKIRSMGLFEDKISVGATDSLWRHLIRPVLLDFAGKYPKISLMTKTGHSWEVVQYLMDDMIQLGFVYSAPSLPGVEVHTIFEDDIVLVQSPKLKLPQMAPPITREQLVRLPFISLDWDGPLQEWSRHMMPRDYFPQIQLDQLSMLVTFVLEGRGVAFVPRCTVVQELARGTLLELPLSREIRPPRRKSFAILRAERRQRPAIQAWFDLLKAHGFKVSPYRVKKR